MIVEINEFNQWNVVEDKHLLLMSDDEDLVSAKIDSIKIYLKINQVNVLENIDINNIDVIKSEEITIIIVKQDLLNLSLAKTINLFEAMETFPNLHIITTSKNNVALNLQSIFKVVEL